MKILLFILCIALSIDLAKSQSIDIKKFFEYENAKLDKVTALANWFFIPGGGSYYAKNNTEGH